MSHEHRLNDVLRLVAVADQQIRQPRQRQQGRQMTASSLRGSGDISLTTKSSYERPETLHPSVGTATVRGVHRVAAEPRARGVVVDPVAQLSLRIAEFLSVLRDHYAEINPSSDPKRRQSSRPRSWTSSLSMAPRCSVYGIDTSPLTRGVTSNCAVASAL
jgi:hypothetical protein